jgi:tetratricopeptide (TPR) repeat protein
MKPVMRAVPGLALSVAMLFGVGCASVANRAVCPAEGGHAWHEVRSAHFLVRTNLDPADAQKVTLDLERFRRALLLIWTRDFDPPGRLEAIVLRTQGQLAEFEKRYAGFAAFTGNGPVIVMDGSGGMFYGKAADGTVQAHELAHYLSRFVLLRQPRWFAEGLASFLETVHLSEDGTKAVFGQPNLPSLAHVRARPSLKLEELWRWEQEFSTLEDPARHYASSWLWFYYLLNEHGPRFTDFQMRLARAEEPRKAFEAAFAGAGDLEVGLQVFLARGTFGIWTLPLEEVPTDTQVRGLEGAEVHAIRARLFLMGTAKEPEERKKAAQLEVTQALSENPTNVSAVQLQADFMDNSVERLALAEALVKARPDSGPAWGLLARAHAQANSPMAVQEQALVRAVELSPDDATAHNDLAWLYVQSNAPQKGYELAVRAVKLAPFSSYFVDTYAAALFAMGQCAKSIKAQRRAIELLHDGATEAARQELHGRLTKYEAVCRERAAGAATNKEESQPGQ